MCCRRALLFEVGERNAAVVRRKRTCVWSSECGRKPALSGAASLCSARYGGCRGLKALCTTSSQVARPRYAHSSLVCHGGASVAVCNLRPDGERTSEHRTLILHHPEFFFRRAAYLPEFESRYPRYTATLLSQPRWHLLLHPVILVLPRVIRVKGSRASSLNLRAGKPECGNTSRVKRTGRSSGKK